jgi:hypothetical protein
MQTNIDRGGTEHLKIETRLIDKRLTSVMGECQIVTLKVLRLYPSSVNTVWYYIKSSNCTEHYNAHHHESLSWCELKQPKYMSMTFSEAA